MKLNNTPQLNRFEKFETKEKVRGALIHQFHEYLSSISSKFPADMKVSLPLYISTLPGATFIFERMLLALKFIQPHLDFHLLCYESKDSVFNDEASHQFGFVKKSPEMWLHKQAGFTISYRKDYFRLDPEFNICWADTCGSANKKFIDEFFDQLNSNPCEGKLVYLTFNMKRRQDDPELKKMVREDKDPMVSNEDILIRFLESKMSQDHTLVFHHEYFSRKDEADGDDDGEDNPDGRGTGMVTLGWHMKKDSQLKKHIEIRDITTKNSYLDKMRALGLTAPRVRKVLKIKTPSLIEAPSPKKEKSYNKNPRSKMSLIRVKVAEVMEILKTKNGEIGCYRPVYYALTGQDPKVVRAHIASLNRTEKDWGHDRNSVWNESRKLHSAGMTYLSQIELGRLRSYVQIPALVSIDDRQNY